jgi:uncharacterized protein YndB with AHSA1/START domain
MDKPQLVYVTYIATTPEAVWKAITDPATTTKYWHHVNVSDWRVGSNWEHHEGSPGGKLNLVGKVVESDPPRRLVLTWAEPTDAGNEAKTSRVVFDIEPYRGLVKLTVTHDRLEPGSTMLDKISLGWPMVLSSLKSMLERGEPLPKLW